MIPPTDCDDLKTEQCTAPDVAAHPTRAAGRRWYLIASVGLALLALKLASTGVTWGMPSVVSWAPDTIAGTRTLFTLDKWPDRWTSHYPPFHFLINRVLYSPWLSHWQGRNLMRRAPDSGELVFAPPVHEKIGALIMVSRVLTVLMSVAAVMVLTLVAGHLFGDRLAGLMAGLALASCAEWTFFSHLGNLDVPQMFWFTLSLLAYVGAWQTDRAHYFVLLGVLTALAVSTKDGVAGAYVGVVVVLAVTGVSRHRASGTSKARSLLAMVRPKMLLGLACFAIPYVIVNGLWCNPAGYAERMRYWLGGPGVSDFNQAYQGQLWLAREALAEAARGLGWPLLVSMIAGTAYALVRHPRMALAVLVPAAAYYIVVPASIHLVYARMLFPAFICLAVLLGKAAADWLRWKRWPAALRAGCCVLVFATSLGYCAAVDLEMRHDTRARAEAWLIENVQPGPPLGVFAPAQYLPRFTPQTHRAALLEMTPETFIRGGPEHLILTSHNYEDFDSQQRQCLDRLLAGDLGYRQVAGFTNRYLPPQRHWLSLAGWGTRGAGKVSPEITILRRE